MQEPANEIETLSRRRARLGLWITASFLLVLASIAANDRLVQGGRAAGTLRTAVLVGMALAALLLIMSLAQFVILTRHSFINPELRRKLWDELARANHGQSMVAAYFATLFVLVALAIVSMFTELSAPWVINGALLTAFLVQAASFALLERRGEAGDA